ncbi:GntR family transcriptional regulator [Marinobacterium nitratireducens]|uniref:GntR family transcriptional regulator n=1 Tax=Marinobacterium nitratireducens TaxID=518897 RepID=A0A917ZCM9_9GAMM|nr:PLP-dependent aminotransferase family protein [Marinobacterium nitratireducens]GGO80838.1 GntR family transcriptional regulator [Marinobacterium nitratireducens]
MKLYEQVADELRQRIDRGYYRCGDRLPSIRSLSREHGISIATVQEAYRLLEDQGLAEARPKSGYYVRPRPATPAMPAISRPAQRPLEVSQWEQVLDLLCASEQPGILALGRGMPDIDAPSLKPLQRALASGPGTSGHRGLAYDSLRGSQELRQQVARLGVDSGCRLHPDDIVVTTGCQEALSISLRAVTRPGDVVAVDSPSFYGTMQAIKAFGLKAMEIPTDPVTGISLDALELALEKWPIRVIQITPTCNNPLGYTMPDDHRRQLLSLAQRFDVAIIEDDIYGDLSYAFPRPRTIKSFDSDGRVLLCSSFSKTLAPGLRVGWVAPGRYGEQVLHMKYVGTAACATLPQLAVADFIAEGHYERHLRRMRAQYQQSRDQMIAWVERHFPAGTRISYPQGGFLLWAELPGDADSIRLNERLLAQGIRIGPGPLFSASGKYRNCLRLNYSDKPDARIEAAVRKVGEEATRMLLELNRVA